MKRVLALTILVFSFSSLADCILLTKYTELRSGLNKDTICSDTLIAVTTDYRMSDVDLVISANSGRETYQVSLEAISLTTKSGQVLYKGAGTMHWYPGDSYVILSE